MRRYINVLLPIPLQNPIYTYIIEEQEIEGHLTVGQLVVVPFGRGNKRETGIVWEVLEQVPTTKGIHYKKVHRLLSYEPIPTPILRLWQWVADYYMYSLGEIFNAAVPNTFRPTLKQSSDDEPKEYQGHLIRGWLPNWLLLSNEDRMSALLAGLKRSKTTFEAIELLQSIPAEELSTPLSLKLWQERLGVGLYAINKLRELQIMVEGEVLLSDILQRVTHNEREQVKDQISTKIESATAKTLLIHYPHSHLAERLPMAYILEALEKEQQLLLLLPSLEALHLVEKLLKQQIPNRQLWSYHSETTPHQRDKAWMMALEGSSGLFVGLRSAVWLPFDRLTGVVIIDEEDIGYRQYEPAPRFTASRVAQMLAHFSKAQVVLVSNTPSVESYANALRQKYQLIKVEGAPTKATLQTVDMVATYEKNKVVARLISFELARAIDEAVLAKETTLLLYQRKGYAKWVTCNDCGTSRACPKCHTTYRYYAKSRQLVCPMCGHYEPLTPTCPTCGRENLQATGTGIERLVEAVRERYSGVEVLHYQETAHLPKAKGARIIITDSYSSPLLLLQEATVVGVLQLDLLTQRFTFRANELAYRFLVQCQEEAPKLKQMVVQFFAKGQNALTAWQEGQYKTLLDHELKERHMVGFPPFSRQIDICFESRERKVAATICQTMAKQIAHALPECTLLDPAPLPNTKRGTDIGYKLTLLVPLAHASIEAKSTLREIRETILTNYRGPQLRIYFDVDPE